MMKSLSLQNLCSISGYQFSDLPCLEIDSYHLEFTGVCSSAAESYRGNVIKDKLFSGTSLAPEAQVPPQTQCSLKKGRSVPGHCIGMHGCPAESP